MSRISTILNTNTDQVASAIPEHRKIHLRTAPAKQTVSRVASIISQCDENVETMTKDFLPKIPAVKQGKEFVNNPPHYHAKCTDEEMKAIISRINERGYIEAIDVIDAFFKDNFNLGTAFRYEARLGAKDDEITELDKAIWYLQHEKAIRLSKKN